MISKPRRETAGSPEQLAILLLERLNAGDVSGITSLYENNALLVLPNGRVARGALEIREFYNNLLKSRPAFTPGRQSPALVNGDIALISSTLTGGNVTVEVARRQIDGTWLWIIDHPAIGSATTGA